MSTPQTQNKVYQRLDTFKLPAGWRGRSAAFVQLWWIVQALLIHPSPQVAYGWRRWILRLFGARVGSNVLIRPSVRVTFPWRLTIGDYVWIGDNVELYSLAEITIGAHAVVSQGSYLCTGSHDANSPSFDIFAKPIIVGEEAWIAAQAFVCPGVRLGRGSVVGARSFVTEDTREGGVYFGKPARYVRQRNPKEIDRHDG